MRDRVDDADFMLKREKLRRIWNLPIPIITQNIHWLLSDPDIPYSRAMHQGRAQDELLLNWCKGGQPELTKSEMHAQLMDLSKKFENGKLRVPPR